VAVIAVVWLCCGAATNGQLLTGRLRHVRFSPDGQCVLSQTDSGIAVLTVQPFGRLFTISIGVRGNAGFTPDSREIVFLNPAQTDASTGSSYVERWRVAEGRRIGSVPVADKACASEALSPDGGVLACVDGAGTLRVIEVSSGGTTFEKKKLGKLYLHASGCILVGNYDPTQAGQGQDCVDQFPTLLSGHPGSAALEFSPDGRFLIAVPTASRGSPVAFDVRENRTVRLRGALRKRRAARVFLTPDLVLVSWERCAPLSLKTSCANVHKVVAFPSGETVANLGKTLYGVQLARTTDPVFVLLPTSPARAVNYHSGESIASEGAILDVFGHLYVAQCPDGRLGLFDMDKGLQGTVMVLGN
jgi:hypothetical protein